MCSGKLQVGIKIQCQAWLSEVHVLGTKKVRDFLLSLHLLQEACVGYKVKEFFGRKLMLDFLDWLCWREDTHRYRQTHRERERERERESWREGTDVHKLLQKTDDVGACCIFVGCFGIHQHQSCNCQLAQQACLCSSLVGSTWYGSLLILETQKSSSPLMIIPFNCSCRSAADLSCVLVAISCLVQQSMFVSKGLPSIPILGCLRPCECLI